MVTIEQIIFSDENPNASKYDFSIVITVVNGTSK